MKLHLQNQGPNPFLILPGLTIVRGSLSLSHSCIVQHYLRILLPQGFAVAFVNAEHSLEHYQFALKKLGHNLQTYQQAGNLRVLGPPLAAVHDLAPQFSQSPLPLPQQYQQQLAASGNTSSGCGARSEVSVSGCSSPLRQLYGDLRRAVEQQQAAVGAVAVILDSLTALAILRESEEEWSAFLHYCCCCSGGGGSVPYCVIAGVYDDVPEDRSWLASLEHRANLVVSVEPLPGRIADVDGMVTVTRRFAMEGAVCLPTGRPAPGPAAAASVDAAAPLADGQTQPLSLPLWDVTLPHPWRRTLYFKSSELSVKWMDHVTSRELL